MSRYDEPMRTFKPSKAWEAAHSRESFKRRYQGHPKHVKPARVPRGLQRLLGLID